MPRLGALNAAVLTPAGATYAPASSAMSGTATMPTRGSTAGGAQTLLVFDEYVPNTTTVYTAAQWNAAIGQRDQISIHCVVDNQNNIAAGTIYVQIQHSADGRNWAPKSAGNGEISTAGNVPANNATPPNNFGNLFGQDNGNIPNLGLVRLAITLVSPCTAAHVKIHVTSRERK